MSLSGSLPSQVLRGCIRLQESWAGSGLTSWLALQSFWSLSCLLASSVDRAFLGFFPHMPTPFVQFQGPIGKNTEERILLTQWAVTHFLLGRFCNPVIHFLILKKKKKETIVLFCFPEKEIDLKLSKNIYCLIFCVKLLFSLVVILQLWLMNFGIRFISALGHLLIKKLHCLL